MSYIRNTENPEKLYIYGTFSHSYGGYVVDVMMGSNFIGAIPSTLFEEMIAHYRNCPKEDFYKKHEVKEYDFSMYGLVGYWKDDVFTLKYKEDFMFSMCEETWMKILN